MSEGIGGRKKSGKGFVMAVGGGGWTPLQRCLDSHFGENNNNNTEKNNKQAYVLIKRNVRIVILSEN